MNHKNIPLSNYTIGKCIYCGRTDLPLSREHIVPYGLNGEWVLQKASCSVCSDITSKFELSVLRGMLPQARAALNLRTRRSHPTSFPTTMEIDGVKKTVDLPLDEYGAMVVFPTFRLPAYLEGRESLTGTLDILGASMQRITGPDVNELHKKYHAKSIDFRFEFNPFEFIKLMAKMAYGYSVLCYGVDAFEEVYVLPMIKGNVDVVDKWIGSEPAITGTEEISIELDEKDKEVVARVRLFGKRHIPTYVVVVGRLKK